MAAFFLCLVVFGAGKTSKAAETSSFDVILPDTNGRKFSPTTNSPPYIRLDIVGPIMPDNSSALSPSGVGIDYVRSALNESRMGTLKNNKIKGILLYINSPGGAGYLCEPIYEAIKEYSNKYEVPVYAYVEGYCASAAMYIACSANKIYANSSSLIGSVGGYWEFFNVSEGMQKVGIQNKTLSAGKGKNAMNPFQPWQEGASDNYQMIVDKSYQQFVDVVSEARPKFTKDLLINKYGAQVLYPNDAEKYGYIDGAGYQYNQVVQMLAEASGIQGTDYQLIQLQPKVKLSDLFSLTHRLADKSKFLKSLKDNPLLPPRSNIEDALVELPK